MATELTSLTESEVALIQLRGAAELVTPDEGDIPEMVMDIDRLVADWRRLKRVETAAKEYIATRRQTNDALSYGLIADPRGERAYHDSWTFLCNAVQEYEDARRAVEAPDGE